ncbi:hypothetical protein V2W45_1212738, partial [Cenococcum geophilum]
PENWSGCKQLIDFLDNLFSLNKIVSAKFSKLHHFIKSTKGDRRYLEHYFKLVLFKCF